MRAHLDAVTAALNAALTPQAYHGQAPASASYPYLVVELAWSHPGEQLLDGAAPDLTLTVNVKGVGLTAASALEMLDLARAVLTPGGYASSLTVTGRVAEVRWLRHEADYIDTQWTDPATNTHPCVSLDAYRVSSTPA